MFQCLNPDPCNPIKKHLEESLWKGCRVSPVLGYRKGTCHTLCNPVKLQGIASSYLKCMCNCLSLSSPSVILSFPAPCSQSDALYTCQEFTRRRNGTEHERHEKEQRKNAGSLDLPPGVFIWTGLYYFLQLVQRIDIFTPTRHSVTPPPQPSLSFYCASFSFL